MPTQTLELYDGVTTLDLIDESNYATQYTPGLGIPRAPHVPTISGDTLSAIEFKPRTVSMVVDVLGTTQADMTINIAALERMLTIAQERQITQQGTKVVLIVQQGTTAANDVSYTVLNGSLSLDESAIRSVSIAALRTRATLTLLVEPFGKLPTVTLGRKTLHNERDGANINHADIGDGFGGYFSFDGSNSVLNCGSGSGIDNIFDSGGFLRMRLRLDNLSGVQGLIHKNHWFTNLSTAGEIRFFQTFDSTSADWNTTNAGLVADTWYMLEIGYDNSGTGNQPTIKVDGTTLTTAQARFPVGTRTDDAADNLFVGTDGGQKVAGDISEVALYSAAGISDSITQQLDGTETNLVAYWPFEEGSGTTVKDRDATGGNDGTLTVGSGVWGADPTKGNAGALLQVRIEDQAGTAWTAAKTLYIATRSGTRRADVLFDDVPNAVTNVDADILAGAETSAGGTTGGPTSNASGGTSAYFRTTANATSALQPEFLSRGYFDYQFTTLPKGLFRVLARCQVLETATNVNISVASIFGFALGWNFGGVTSTPVEADRVAISAFSQWELLDLGEISIPPAATPTGFTDPTLSIRVNACVNLAPGGNNMANTEYLEWSSDFLFLLPIDEGSAIINSVDATDEVLLSLSSDPPGAWLLNTSSVTQQFADYNGAPIRLGPEATRLYWIKDDPKDPSTMIAYAYASYVPLVSGL